MKIENVVKEISYESLNDNERELLERLRSLNETDRIAIMHKLYSTAFEGVLSEIQSENVGWVWIYGISMCIEVTWVI